MITAFKKHIESNALYTTKHKIIVAVSGGIDSSVLLHLLHACKYKCIVAHCNFGLRGKESDADELFVKKLANKYSFPFRSIRFETSNYAIEHGISIQMAARDLRYNWFNELLEIEESEAIAIAHNKNDVAETMLLNLSRGTGIRGLSGIQVQLGRITRPLLFAKRDKIETYANANKIKFREDSSNKQTKYKRNRIRHIVIPELEKLNPSFIDSISLSATNIKASVDFYSDCILKIKNEIITTKKDQFFINIAAIKNNKHGHIILYELLREYDFNGIQCDAIYQSLTKQAGNLFSSLHYTLNVDREQLIISKQKDKIPSTVLIKKSTKEISVPIALKIEKKTLGKKKYDPIQSSKIASLDVKLLQFPLTLRLWETGDRFRPLGMRSSKKLSDFYTDIKLSRAEKECTYVITSNNEIVWVVGHRIDDRYKITTETNAIVVINVM